MLPLTFDKAGGLNILCLGAHCDDIEIGCGGTLLKLIKKYSIMQVVWVVITSTPARASEAKKSAEYFLSDVKSKQVIVKDFIDTILPQQLLGVKQFFEEIKLSFKPDIILTHCRHDLHQDHRLVNELTWNTYRDCFILEYEIQKYDGDLGHPGFFVPLDEEIVRSKVNALMEYYPTQSGKHWFDQDTFRALMRIRGLECAARYAEAFYVRKSVL